ncbi:sugar ABC transporter substrate-binding protein [Microbacterium sp. kSW2-24]|uniref:sugar ABC transporter substrate-binding protein n=1 Tax=Microbacterium galbinum TaxID=2851646 RepID=UPI001FFC6ABE|nr:sugar ABC transporter substrate-binding protein [Microbacterium galbinum]MCK2023341.1 sugar ABC transporter substrate-binding protein [Microbacterium galbinum]
MNKSRATALAALVASSALLLAGCTMDDAPASDSSGPVSSGEVNKILFDYPFTALPVYASLTQAVAEYAETQGVEVVFTNDNMDLATQVSQLTTHLGSDIDAVVSFPMDNAAVQTVAKQYMDEGKLWVTYGGDLDEQSSSLQFSFHDSGEMLGEDAGEWITENLDGAAKVLVLGDRSIQLGQERTTGILDGLEAAAPDAEIIEQQAITPDEGLSVTSAVLAQHPDVDVVVATSGDAAAGAYQALIASGRAANDANTYLGGLDGNLTLYQEMKAGNFVRGVVTVKSSELAQAIVDFPVKLGKGEETERFDVPVYFVTAESPDLDDYIIELGG